MSGEIKPTWSNGVPYCSGWDTPACPSIQVADSPNVHSRTCGVDGAVIICGGDCCEPAIRIMSSIVPKQCVEEDVDVADDDYPSGSTCAWLSLRNLWESADRVASERCTHDDGLEKWRFALENLETAKDHCAHELRYLDAWLKAGMAARKADDEKEKTGHE